MFEAHPVPQNVTEFEFHLVGDMTIKQFMYLGSGLFLAYLTFALLSSRVPLLAYPLILIFAGSGAALAFLPIQDRPLDHWLASYFRAIFQPTKRVYKSKLITKEDPLFKTRLQVYLNSKKNPMLANIPNKNVKSTPFSFQMTSVNQTAPAPTIIATAPAALSTPAVAPVPPVIAQPAAAPDPQQSTILGSSSLSSMSIPSAQASPPPTVTSTPLSATPVAQTPQPTPVVAAPIAAPAPLPQVSQPMPAAPLPNQPAPAPSSDELQQTIEVAKQVHEVQQKIMKTEEQINLIRSKAASQDANPKDYLDQFHQLLGELQNLNQEAATLSQQVAVLTKEPPKLVVAKPEPVVKAKSIPTITLTSIQNVLNGIVTDSAGNYLDGSIILAHDKQGIPVRALKTNKLGQFVAATPLNNGIYTITIEKDDLVFDTIEIELEGEILKPILITAKPVGGAA